MAHMSRHRGRTGGLGRTDEVSEVPAERARPTPYPAILRSARGGGGARPGQPAAKRVAVDGRAADLQPVEVEVEVLASGAGPLEASRESNRRLPRRQLAPGRRHVFEIAEDVAEELARPDAQVRHRRRGVAVG